jgi:hypothetical protein
VPLGLSWLFKSREFFKFQQNSFKQYAGECVTRSIYMYMYMCIYIRIYITFLWNKEELP